MGSTDISHLASTAIATHGNEIVGEIKWHIWLCSLPYSGTRHDFPESSHVGLVKVSDDMALPRIRRILGSNDLSIGPHGHHDPDWSKGKSWEHCSRHKRVRRSARRARRDG
jgi:hypothetical protein